MNELEKSWEESASQIARKLTEATEALRAANRLASEAGVQSFIVTQWTYDDLGAEKAKELGEKLKAIRSVVSELESEINDAGWSTSSAYC